MLHGAGCYWINRILNAGKPIFLWVQESEQKTLLIWIVMSIFNAILCFVVIRTVMNRIPARLMGSLPFQHWVPENRSFWSWKQYPYQPDSQVRLRPLGIKITRIFMGITIFAAVLLVVVNAIVYQENTFENYESIAMKYADMAASQVMENQIDAIVSENGDRMMTYEFMKRRLDAFVEQNEFITFVYVYQIILSEEGIPKIRVIYDSDPYGNGFGDVFDTDEEYYDSLRDPLADFYSNETIGPTVSNGEWGWLMSVYKPVFNARGEKKAYVGIDLSMDDIMAGILEIILKISSLTVMTFIFLNALLYSSIRGMVGNPVRRLDALTRYFRDSQETEIDRSNPIRTGDEFENLYDTMLSAQELILEKNRQSAEYTETIRQLAYKDELTGVKNMTSYEQKVSELEAEIQDSAAEFAVVMVDMNDLKQLNDQLGHEKGNIAIQRMCKAICRIYGHSPVYRIGGDEFAVILEGADYRNRDVLTRVLSRHAIRRNLEGPAPWNEVALSYGMSVYDAKADSCYSDVYNRADQAMYEKKRELKKASE